ncbi:MAG: ABC transporter permease, partial [Desulfobacteraceae bacterium]
MACVILLFLFIRDEFSYDKYHSKHDRIYMVQSNYISGDVEKYGIFSSLALGPALKDEYPVIKEIVRTFSSGGLYFIDQNGEVIEEDNICYADQGIFRMFDYKFFYGTPDGALDSPDTIVLSQSLAKKYFGDNNPVGKILKRNNGISYTVRGVYEDHPRNSFDRFRALISINNLKEIYGDSDILNNRDPRAFFNRISFAHTYILLGENADIETIKTDYERFKEKYYAKHGRETNRDME